MEDEISPDQAEIDAAWVEENQRRMAAFRAGEMESEDGEKVMKELREKYKEKSNKRYERKTMSLGTNDAQEQPLSLTGAALLSAVRTLPPREREKIAQSLLDEVESENDEPFSQSQLAEFTRRAEEVKRGTARLIDGEEAMRLFHERKKV